MWNPQPPKTHNRGRPKGSAQVLALEARRRAQETGELPHEFLLRVTRGELIKGYAWDPVKQEQVEVYESADLTTRIDAAKGCAGYFAPKLQAVEVIGTVMGRASDDELDSLIAELATQAGVSVGIAGEGEEDETQQRPRRRVQLTRSP